MGKLLMGKDQAKGSTFVPKITPTTKGYGKTASRKERAPLLLAMGLSMKVSLKMG